MPEIDKHEIKSPELQEVMSEIPGRFLRWGLFLFFAIILVILGVTWFINYPDIVTAPVTITTYNSPAPLVTKSGGKIEKLLVDNGEDVTTDQSVAIIENTAVYEDLLTLVEFLDTLDDNPDWQNKVAKYIPPENLSIGEIQTSYSRFVTYFFQFGEYLRQSYILSKLKLFEQQIRNQQEYTAELLKQEKLSEEDLKLVLRSYERDSVLYHSSLHSITLSEYERSKQVLIQKKSAHSSLRASIKNNESSALKMKETRLDLQVQLDKELHQYILDLDDSYKMLTMAIDQWKDKYLVKSPVKGRITFTSYWNINQVIKAGEILATVIPDDPSRIIVRANVPVSGLGKVKTGQEVNIKLSGFPYMEYGVLKGKVSILSLVPAGDYYIAEIDLIGGLKSTYRINLDFINEMTGTADIITEDSRLIFRLIKPLRSILN